MALFDVMYSRRTQKDEQLEEESRRVEDHSTNFQGFSRSAVTAVP